MTAPIPTKRILVVDDEPALLVLLQKVLSKKCASEVEVTQSGEEALALISTWQPDVVLTDVKMQGIDGLDLLKLILAADPTITIIIMTGYGTVKVAVQALKNGAYDFFEKPFDNDKIVMAILRALERTRLLRENLRLHRNLTGAAETRLIGRSPRLRQTVDLLARLADSNATVLIRGQSGTGKEVAARTIHAMCPRADKTMITVNCPALPEQILESELFGYKKGAFTGADRDKDGLFLEADGSTILLDEIADIPVSIQTKLLRVLQEKEIQPLGQTRTFKVDVRVLASTNQDLEKKIERGEFRADLFYRLNVITVTMPSLSEIREDVPLLAQHFLEQYAAEYNRSDLEFTPEALQCLLRRAWRGNVRELRNAVNRAVLLCSGPRITPSNLMDADQQEIGQPHTAGFDQLCPHQMDYKDAKEIVLNRFTTTYLAGMLQRHRGNVSAAARQSGMERQALQRLMRRYEVKAEEFRHNGDSD